MKKSELPNEHIEKISSAVGKGLNAKDWELINILSGGLTGVPVYKIEVDKKYYAIKLEDVNDKHFDLDRNYQIIEMVSKQGTSPFVYFSNAASGIILMDHIEVKPRPEVTPQSIKKFADVIRNLHKINSFPKWKSVIEILNEIYQTFPESYRQNNIIKKCMQEIKTMDNILFDEADIRSCHCDLNPVNILFDGNKYFFIDWQAASPQSFYFDLAYSASWFYFYNEDLCALFLNAYLEREANDEEKAKLYLMRVFTNIYLGIGFISLPLKSDGNTQIISDENIVKLPIFLDFLQSIGSGRVNLADPNIQQQFGFVFLMNAEKMMDQKYQSYYELLQEIN